MSREQDFTFTTEQYAESLNGAKVYVERVGERVKRGQLTNEHLERAQNYLTGIESWKPHKKLAITGQAPIEHKQDKDAGGRQPELDQTPQFIIELSTKTLIDRSSRHAIKFEDEKDFEVLLEIAKAGEEGLPAGEINEICKQHNSTLVKPARDTISKLRTKFADFDGQSAIIQRGKTKGTRYQFNANVEIVDRVKVQPDIYTETTLLSAVPGTEKAKPEETITLPDGQQISTLNERLKKLVEIALTGSNEAPITSEKLRKELYGDDIDTRIAREKLDRDVYEVRKRLAPSGWTVVNAAPHGGDREGMYFLAPIKEAQEDKGAEKAREIPSVEAPKIRSALKLGITRKRDTQLYDLLKGTSVDEPIKAGVLAIMLTGGGQSQVSWEKRNSILRNTLFNLRKTLEQSGVKIEIINTQPSGSHKESEYYLKFQPTMPVPGEAEQKTQGPVIVVNTREHKARIGSRESIIRGKVELGVLKYLAKRPYKKIQGKTIDRIARKLGSKDDNPAGNVIHHLRQKFEEDTKEPKILIRHGLHATPRYELRASVQFIDEKEVLKPVAEEGPTTVPQQVIAPTAVDSGEIRVIHYEPSEEEKRSKIENKTMSYIVNTLISRRRMDFYDLQKSLFSDEYVTVTNTGTYINIHQAEDVIKNLDSALKKIREEAEIPMLQKNWTEEDEEVWKKLQHLLHRDFGDDVASFSERVKREIRKSERRFYREYPPEHGKRVTRIRI